MTKVGVPKEILDNEYRVALTLAGASALVADGHTVYIEKSAGVGSGISDEEYKQTGAQILPDAQSVFAESDLILKVKEPQTKEIPMLRKGQLLFLLICTWQLIQSWLLIWQRPALLASPMKQFKLLTEPFRCSLL